MASVHLSWLKAQRALRTGDILLLRPPPGGSLRSRIFHLGIRRITHSRYIHAAMVGSVWSNHLQAWLWQHAETVGHRNAHIIDLEQEVFDNAGLYDIYRPRGLDFNPAAAWYFMQRCAGSGYGWSYIWRTWARRRLGNWVPPIPSTNFFTTQRDCSGLIHAALRYGNGPQVADYDCDVAPGDLAHLHRFEYIATLL